MNSLGTSSEDLLRILMVGTAAYVVLVVLLRVSGKRTLTKLNAFDLVITVALGSTLATIFLDKDVSLAEGVLALATLVFLQFVVTWTAVRSKRFNGLIKSEPTVLFRNGEFIEDQMRKERVTRDEMLAALRANGFSETSNVAAIVLETDGSLNLVKASDDVP